MSHVPAQEEDDESKANARREHAHRVDTFLAEDERNSSIRYVLLDINLGIAPDPDHVHVIPELVANGYIQPVRRETQYALTATGRELAEQAGIELNDDN